MDGEIRNKEKLKKNPYSLEKNLMPQILKLIRAGRDLAMTGGSAADHLRKLKRSYASSTYVMA